MKLPVSAEPNGDNPKDDGYVVVDANHKDIALVYSEEDAKKIVHALNQSTWT